MGAPSKKYKPAQGGQKPPTPLSIRTESVTRSPHVLNLKNAEKSVASQTGNRDTKFVPLKERIAAFDERLKGIPDFLQARQNNFNELLHSQRENWQQTVSSFLKDARRWGNELQRRADRAPLSAPKTTVRDRSQKTFVTVPTALLRKTAALRLPAFLTHELSTFIIVLLIITIPLQGMLIYRTIKRTEGAITLNWTEGRVHLNAFLGALQNQKFDTAKLELSESIIRIQKLRETVDAFGPLRHIFPDKIRSGYSLLKLTEIAGLSFENTFGQFSDLIDGKGNVSSFINTTSTEVGYLLSKLRLLQEDTNSLEDTLDPIHEKLTSLQDLLAVLAEFSGTQESKHILLVFQNPRELRATGGFAGSMALLTVRDGKLQNIDVPEGGTYDVQGQLLLRRISPEPLHLINPRFELQDANWWPDFPTSAKKITEIYEATGGPTIDGVVAITAYVGEEILKLTGPISTPYESPQEGPASKLSADNFIDTLQSAIERDRAQNRKTPKKIISTLFLPFGDRIIALLKTEPKPLIATLLSSLQKKDIQLWSRDESVQAALKRLGFSGELTQTQGDYLSVITSNVGGGKTDGIVSEEILHNANISTSGVAQVTVTISRTHTGVRGDRLTGLRNTSYVRVYVPKEARFISAEGFTPPPPHRFENPDISLEPDPDVRSQEAQAKTDTSSGTKLWNEKDKMVFGNWIIVDPGKTAVATIRYEVPLAAAEKTIPYLLTVEPQAGKRSTLISRVKLEDGLHLLTGEGDGKWQPLHWNFSGPLEQTLVTSGILYRL